MQIMAKPLTLEHQDFRLSLRTDLGGCVAGFWLDDLPIFRSSPAEQLTSVRQSASYPLAPFSNRIGHARFVWLGTRYELAQNFLPEPHALHGVAWQRAWQVLAASPAHAKLGYQHTPDASWPFAFDCEQQLELTDRGLTMALWITNRHWAEAPVGGGWHPYFVKRPGSHILFSAQARWDMSADKLPTERKPVSGLDTACADLDIDHCFDQWTGNVNLHDELLHIRIASKLDHLVVYTKPDKDFIAIEPVSHVNNAINMPFDASNSGLAVLQPGQSWSAQMTIDVARTGNTIGNPSP